MEIKTLKCDQCGREIKQYEYGQLIVSNVTLQDWDGDSKYPRYSNEYIISDRK